MKSDCDGVGPSVPNRALRGALVLAGLVALGAAAAVLVAVGSLLTREPQTPAEAHAMAHSASGIVLALVVTAGFGLAGVALLVVAYTDRRRRSAGMLVLVGLVALLAVGGRRPDAVAVAGLGAAALGGYALYEDATGENLIGFVATVTALVWFVQVLLFVDLLAFTSGFALSWYVPAIGSPWVQRALGVGSTAMLASVARRRYRGCPVEGAWVALAAAVVLVLYVPGAVWSALPSVRVVGLDLLTWLSLATGTVAAVTVLDRSLGDVVR